MVAFIIILLLVWILLGIVGALVKGLLWLLFIAVVLFLVTGWLGLRGGGRKRVGS